MHFQHFLDKTIQVIFSDFNMLKTVQQSFKVSSERLKKWGNKSSPLVLVVLFFIYYTMPALLAKWVPQDQLTSYAKRKDNNQTAQRPVAQWVKC